MKGEESEEVGVEEEREEGKDGGFLEER